jgi:hypothetical protein
MGSDGIDAASQYVHVTHQISFTASETIASKMRFEGEALTHGVQVLSYHTDNSVFRSSCANSETKGKASR